MKLNLKIPYTQLKRPVRINARNVLKYLKLKNP